MALQGLWQAVANWPLAQYIASSSWAFPTIETIHVIAIVTVVGSITVMDLRLLGLASAESRVTEISNDTLPWTWGAFVIALITGSLLFISKATDYTVNPFFIWKMVVIIFAGLNMGVFHLMTWRSIDKWDLRRDGPTGAKLAGALSLTLWLVVVFLGRAIGFTLDKFAS
jgi:hypothetical protein